MFLLLYVPLLSLLREWLLPLLLILRARMAADKCLPRLELHRPDKQHRLPLQRPQLLLRRRLKPLL